MADDENHGGPRGAPPKKDLPDAYQEFLEGLFYANQVFEYKDDAGRDGITIACVQSQILAAIWCSRSMPPHRESALGILQHNSKSRCFAKSRSLGHSMSNWSISAA
jgi:hypothetical protein